MDTADIRQFPRLLRGGKNREEEEEEEEEEEGYNRQRSSLGTLLTYIQYICPCICSRVYTEYMRGHLSIVPPRNLNDYMDTYL